MNNLNVGCQKNQLIYLLRKKERSNKDFWEINSGPHFVITKRQNLFRKYQNIIQLSILTVIKKRINKIIL